MQPAHAQRPVLVRLVVQFVALLVLAALAAGAAYEIQPDRPVYDSSQPPQITLESAQALTGALWIDARPPAAYAADHIPGAISLSEDGWEGSLGGFVEAWRPGQRIIVYCDSSRCRASEAVARRLVREFSATDVQVLKGGWESWKERH
jgi:rhodanese-related sulfurtransferase